jgi:hypothetical protein
MNEEKAELIYDSVLKLIEDTQLGNTTTTSSQLEDFGKKMFGGKFAGVYPADMIPELTKKTPYAIANLDESGMPGSHWVALCRSPNREKMYMYDSFARGHKTILPQVMGKNVVDGDDDREQDFAETNCGQRSMAYICCFDKWSEDMAKLI